MRTRDAWQMLSDEVSAADEATPEQTKKAEQAHKDYIRASKEYLAIAFKKRFLER
ncbi:hypothetical protein N9F03_04695 [Planktomarina temperata]|nr:hypothetical protein [Planktomarina temperata]